MNATLLLCDVARAAEGKLDVLGAGWRVINSGQVNFGIGVLIEVPWAQVGETHTFDLVIADDQGRVVTAPNGEPLLQGHGEFETQRPPGVLLGAPIVIPLPFNVSALLPPSQRFRLMLTIDGHHEVAWEAEFSTRPPEPGISRLAG